MALTPIVGTPPRPNFNIRIVPPGTRLVLGVPDRSAAPHLSIAHVYATPDFLSEELLKKAANLIERLRAKEHHWKVVHVAPMPIQARLCFATNYQPQLFRNSWVLGWPR